MLPITPLGLTALPQMEVVGVVLASGALGDFRHGCERMGRLTWNKDWGIARMIAWSN